MDLRVTTFNVENLFNRYAFLDREFEGDGYEAFVRAVGIVSIANRQGELVAEPTTVIQRNNTALAIEEAAPDILAVQEVENVYTLRIFNEQFLDNYFHQIVLLDGNDPRGIDVGLLVRAGLDAQVLGYRSHIDDALKNERVERQTVSGIGYLTKNAIFSRDCLEVDIKVNGKVLTFLVNHFKAQDQNATSSEKRRRAQAERVGVLVEEAKAAGRFPIVLGDLNVDPKVDTSLSALLNHPKLSDPFVQHINDEKERWSHFYDSKKSVSRLDYTLVDKQLNVKGVEVVRKGLTTKCKQYKGTRFPTVGPVHTEASDHCPVTTVITV